ncbi:hypothetical protein [Anaeromyxobacter oryzae]|uniref:Uncharacterized protein n=1 Tax=Anaeromyxobacter oryzae TaxID=2918170 RepID=A0ABM7WTT5_9BACT|nr:hypothetical protein [Anaeromyxobacter oryzae]BDG02878.1 hypothetical protein AMOR_18740 [Anaeromyxobacter oryzae]
MSLAAKRITSPNRHHCSCGHLALYPRRRGGVSARADHPLCRRCWRSEFDRARAQGQARWRCARVVLPAGVILPDFIREAPSEISGRAGEGAFRGRDAGAIVVALPVACSVERDHGREVALACG